MCDALKEEIQNCGVKPCGLPCTDGSTYMVVAKKESV